MIKRILIVGYGSIGKRHLRIIRESLPSADIRILRHSVFTDIPDLSNGCFSNINDACDFAPQIAVIANPASFHIKTALALVDAGSNLIVEKPLSDSLEGVELLIKRMHEKKLILHVGYNLRFLDSLKEFRKYVKQQEVGKVISIRCEIGQYLPSWRPGTDYRQSASARKDLGGGVLLELSHELDYLRWIFGEVTWVSAWVGKQSQLEINVEDIAHLTLGFTPDTVGQTKVAALTLDFFRQDSTRLCTVIGESGSLRWNGITGDVEKTNPNNQEWQVISRYESQRDESYRVQWQYMCDCVANQTESDISGEDGLAVLNIIDAARVSTASKCAQISVKSH